MRNNSLIDTTQKWFFGLKGEDLTPWANRPQRNTPTTETHLYIRVHGAKIHASQGTRWRNQKMKKHAMVQLHPYTYEN